MSQRLYLGSGKFIVVDRIFAAGGEPAQYGTTSNGQRILLSMGSKPQPEILMVGKEFFYKDGSPVLEEAHVSHLPEKFRKIAVEFINKGSAKPIKAVASKEEAVPKKGKGRPKKQVAAGRKPLEIKDEESLLAAAGGRLVVDE